MVFQGLVYAWVHFYLPLPIVLTLMASSPIFTAIFDKIIYGVSLNRVQIIWLSIAFCGVILTANGTYLKFLITGKEPQSHSKFENYFSKDPLVMVAVGTFFTLIMCLHGYAVVCTKKLRNTSSVQISYMIGLLVLLSSGFLLPSALADPFYHKPTTWELFLAFLCTGVPMALGQLIGISALILTKNYGMLTPFNFSTIVLGYLVSIWRYE